MLCGPPGSGKISALRIAVQTIFPLQHVQWLEWLDESLGSDEVTELEEFVKQSSRYQIVTGGAKDMNCVNGTPFIIVLKNLPVSLGDCASRFHSLLRFHATNAPSSSLLVLSCTSSSSARENLLSERVLCPAFLRNELQIARIEFNPVAPTLLLKALNRIVKHEHPKGKVASRAVLQQIVSCSAGDLRIAVNQLQFLCQTVRKSGGIGPASDSHSNTGRDPGLSLFHALGKFLYGKRNKPKCASDYAMGKSKVRETHLPAHLGQWRRSELTFDVDDVLEQCQISGDQAISWLHENYPDFMPHMTAIDWVSKHISWADAHLSGGMNWRLGLTPAADWNAPEFSGSVRQPLGLANRHYGALVVVRALLLAHDIVEESVESDLRTQSRQGFRPLRAPTIRDASKVSVQLRDAWCDLSNHCNDVFEQFCSPNHFIADRCRWLFDYLPIAGKVTNARACLDRNPAIGELIATISAFNRKSHLEGHRFQSSLNKIAANTPVTEGICPSDALSEGDALPIDEDVSDDESR